MTLSAAILVCGPSIQLATEATDLHAVKGALYIFYFLESVRRFSGWPTLIPFASPVTRSYLGQLSDSSLGAL